MNREVIYERNIAGSYMKIPMGINAELDERLMLRRKLQGTLPVEKTYVDGVGQYWYNISGKQSLDTYCRVRDIGIEFVERLVVSICSEVEILEWNLIHTNCLMLDPELVFITNSNREFIFTIYPGNNTQIETEFQQLMEFLLTKIDHKDEKAVRAAYGIYEKTLEEGYSIMDIRDFIQKTRQQEVVESDTMHAEPENRKTVQLTNEGKELPKENRISRAGREMKMPEKKKCKKDATKSIVQRLLDLILGSSKKTPEIEPVVYPEEESYETYMQEEEIYPTVCLSNFRGSPRGILLYQGAEQMGDISLEGKVVKIGHGKEADVCIDRDTISQLHARIDRDGDTFYIEDLNSTNGTFVNEEPLVYKERRQLKMNDIVRLADVRYRFT